MDALMPGARIDSWSCIPQRRMPSVGTRAVGKEIPRILEVQRIRPHRQAAS